jgi:hypothetical protein
MESACKPEAFGPSISTLTIFHSLLELERALRSNSVSSSQLVDELASRASHSQLLALTRALNVLYHWVQEAQELSSYSPTDSSSSSPERIPTASDTGGRADSRHSFLKSMEGSSTPFSTHLTPSLEQQVGDLRQAVVDTNKALALQQRLADERLGKLERWMRYYDGLTHAGGLGQTR